MPIPRIAVFLRWDDHPQYGEWIDPIAHMKHPSSTLTPRRWWVPHFGSTLWHANGHHPRCIGSSGCSVAGKHGDAFIDLVKSDETKMRGKEIKEEITPNEFVNQQDSFKDKSEFWEVIEKNKDVKTLPWKKMKTVGILNIGYCQSLFCRTSCHLKWFFLYFVDISMCHEVFFQ